MGSLPKAVVLEAEAIRFYSPGDDLAFSNWLDRLACVESLEGRGHALYITINTAALDEIALRELLALFHRYEIDMAQLAIFDCAAFVPWFRDAKTYWHEKVFGRQVSS